MPKYRKINDVWHLYQYGDIYKAVYIKKASQREKECELLFPELEGLPLELRKTALTSAIYGGNIVAEGPLPERTAEPSKAQGESTEERLASSISRTKARIYEYALCNEFQFFCTFTQSAEKVKDRYNLTDFRKSFSQWVRNQNRERTTPIRYLLIPEQHKDGAWHLHGLIAGLVVGVDLVPFSLKERLPYSIRNTLKKGETVYNWEKYSNKYGFFTATAIKSKLKASAYITKYVTKDVAQQGRESGAHLFFASQGLNKRERIFRNGVGDDGIYIRCPFDDDEWDFENEYVKVKWITDFSNISVPKTGL